MIEKEIQDWKTKIDGMGQVEMASLRRFARIGHPVFDNTLPLFEYFEARFAKLGGMTPEISKEIGWQ